MAGILILIIFLPGLKEIDWLTAQYTIFVCGFIVLFFGGLLLTTSLGINVMRSGELVPVFVPISKPFARLFGFCFFARNYGCPLFVGFAGGVYTAVYISDYGFVMMIEWRR